MEVGKRQPAEFLPPIVQNCCSQPSFIGSNPAWHAMVRVNPATIETFLQIRKLLLVKYWTKWGNTVNILSPEKDVNSRTLKWRMNFKGCSDVPAAGHGKECESNRSKLSASSESSLPPPGECPSLSRSKKDLGKGCKSRKIESSLLPPRACSAFSRSEKEIPNQSSCQATAEMFSFLNIFHCPPAES